MAQKQQKERPTKHTPEKDALFFAAIAKGMTIHDAADGVSYNWSYVYQRRREDTEFAKLWEDADEKATQRLEREADRRAMGWEDPIYNKKGQKIAGNYKSSDTLLIFRLKAKRPEVYRERIGVEAQVSITFGLADRLEAARKRSKPK